MTTRSLVFTHDSRTTSKIYNNSISSIPPWSLQRSQPWPTLGPKPWSLRQSQPDQHLAPNRDPYGDHNQLISSLLSTLFLLLLTHGVTYFRPGPLSVGAAIDRFNIHSVEVSTQYPHYGTHGLALPFGWTNGVSTKPIYCHDTLPATPAHSPLG